MFRTPEPGRFECRAVSAAVNPYLGMAAFIPAGMDGVKQRMVPGEPYRGNMYEMPMETMRKKGIQVVPQILPEALAALEADAVVQSALGPDLTQEWPVTAGWPASATATALPAARAWTTG